MEDISAGLSISVVKNAHLQGHPRHVAPTSWASTSWCRAAPSSTTRCCAAFEQELGRNVTRPNIAGLMGAYGAALYAKGICQNQREHTRS